MRAVAFSLCVPLALLLTGAAPPPVQIPLASHRATYEISLEHTSSGGMADVRGRTVIEFRDKCTAWTTTQRFIADMMDSDGDVDRADYIVTSTESKDGRTMSFRVTDMLNGKVRSRSVGTAKAFVSSKGDAVLSQPRVMRFPLPAGAVFPTRHTLDMLAAARAGQGSITRTVFQGGEKDELYSAIATIAPAISPKRQLEEKAADKTGLLKGMRAWPVLVSYYDYGDSSDTPEYEVSSRLYENGIIGSMSLVYDRFTLRARLAKLEALPSSCPAR